MTRIYQARDMRDFKPGVVVRNADGRAYRVMENYGGHAIAVRVQHISNPEEWTIVEGVE